MSEWIRVVLVTEDEKRQVAGAGAGRVMLWRKVERRTEGTGFIDERVKANSGPSQVVAWAKHL